MLSKLKKYIVIYYYFLKSVAESWVGGCDLGKDTFDEESSLKASSTLFHSPLRRFEMYVRPTHFCSDLCDLLDRYSQMEIDQSEWFLTN